MIWLLASAAFSAVKAIGAAKAEKAQAKATNQQIEAYNKATAAAAAKSFNELNVQKAVLADQTEQALFSVRRQGQQLKAERGLQAAASDTLGASVDQALLDADQQVDAASQVLLYNAQISDVSLNSQANAVADSASNALRFKVPVPSNTWSAGLGAFFGQVGTQLIANKISTGAFSGRQQGVLPTRTDINDKER